METNNTKKMTNRKTVYAGTLAADYKARGMDRSRAWSQFVIDRCLSPGINASEFYSHYDTAEAKLLENYSIQVYEAPASPYLDPESVDHGKRVRVTSRVGRHTETQEGIVYRTLQGVGSEKVYEVDFGHGPHRLRGSDMVEFL